MFSLLGLSAIQRTCHDYVRVREKVTIMLKGCYDNGM